MSPELSTAMTLVSIIDKMGGWEGGTILATMFIVPPVLAFFGIRIVAKALYALQKQIASSEANTQQVLAEFKSSYDNNIEFVKNYEKIASALADIIHRNTLAMTKLVDRIDLLTPRTTTYRGRDYADKQ